MSKKNNKRFPALVNNLRSPYGPWQAAYSPDALRRAWTAVRANKGGSGSDGQTIAEFERDLEKNLADLSQDLLLERYRPRPVKQILVPKKNENWRPLTLWTIRDRIAQRATYNYLEPVFDRQFLSCSFGFRSGRGTHDAAEAIAQARQAGEHWVLDADIKDCFGQMKSNIVLKQLQRWDVPGHSDINQALAAYQNWECVAARANSCRYITGQCLISFTLQFVLASF